MHSLSIILKHARVLDAERIDVGGGKTMQQGLSEIPVMCTTRISLLVG